MRKLDIKGTYNVRDVGGMLTKDGATLQEKVLIRSGNLDKLPEASQKKLLDYGVRTVIDVRDEWEDASYPNVFQDSDDVIYHNLPLIGDALVNDAIWYEKTHDYTELHTLYNRYVDDCKQQIGQIVSAFAQAEDAVVIHCYAGKDRTGIVIALILALVGVGDADIASDYAESSKHITHLVDEWRAYAVSKEADMAQFERDNACAPGTILAMLAYIRETYGSVQNYLLGCGVSNDALARLRHKLIAS